VPGLPWWGALALGAIVAPPDAVAAAAVLKKMPLPRRIVSVLEGESLINDASSLVLYRFAVAATLAGGASLGQGAVGFVGAAVGGCLVGWIAGKLTMWIFAHVHGTLLDVMVGLLSGYLAYLAADRIHVSGVLATVVCGLFLGRYQRTQFTAQTRLESTAVWSFLEFFLTSLVFIMIGLQLRGIVSRIEPFNGWDLALFAACSTGALIVSRFVWIFGTSWLRHRLSDSPDGPTPWAHFAVMSWSGMRGVVSLAAALALPGNFPQRDLVVFLAFCAILGTLVLQGTTLRFFIHWLGVEDAGAGKLHREITQGRSRIENAERDVVREHAAGHSEHRAAAEELIGEFESRAGLLEATRDNTEAQFNAHRAQLRLRLVALAKARCQFDAMAESLDPEARTTLMAELDLQETQIRSAMGEATGQDAEDISQ
jgi:Na+/H+ antiporter